MSILDFGFWIDVYGSSLPFPCALCGTSAFHALSEGFSPARCGGSCPVMPAPALPDTPASPAQRRCGCPSITTRCSSHSSRSSSSSFSIFSCRMRCACSMRAPSPSSTKPAANPAPPWVDPLGEWDEDEEPSQELAHRAVRIRLPDAAAALAQRDRGAQRPGWLKASLDHGAV